ncbi:MAG: orotate phosphoribosyltransferase [Sandaracinaceae bacterium]|nr:orotate phosphoribosyltransferase [Sandaracinaceae bacterium]
MTERLLELLRERSFAKKRVILASGKESDFFIDCKQTVLLAEGHALVGAALHDRLARLDPAPVAVAGVALGGCPLASAVAVVSFQRGAPLDAIYVRKGAKDHGSARRIEGDTHLAKGSRVVVVEDVVTTGGSTLDAIGCLREAGYAVDAVVALVDRREGGADAIREAGLAFEALYGREDFLGDPA